MQTFEVASPAPSIESHLFSRCSLSLRRPLELWRSCRLSRHGSPPRRAFCFLVEESAIKITRPPLFPPLRRSRSSVTKIFRAPLAAERPPSRTPVRGTINYLHYRPFYPSPRDFWQTFPLRYLLFHWVLEYLRRGVSPFRCRSAFPSCASTHGPPTPSA